MARMNGSDLFAGEEQQDSLDSLVNLVRRQTLLLAEIRDLLVQQTQRTASTRKAPGDTEARIQLTMGDPQTSMRRTPGSGSS